MNNTCYAILACYPDKGMKSYGSKSLMTFNNTKLLDHQINTIKSFNKKNDNYEIIVISALDTTKLQKNFNQAKIINCNEYNPVYTAALSTNYENIVFIDYGCVFNEKTLSSIRYDTSSVLCSSNSKDSSLDIGCIVDNSSLKIMNMFFDLPDNKFCNIFHINKNDLVKITSNITYSIKNLLYFEIINMLINNDSIFEISYTTNNNFIYFNNMRQKNAISKFFK